MSIFDKFDKIVDLEKLKADIKEAEENGVSYEEVPTGTYDIKIEKMEIAETKKGDKLMLKVQFRILEGDFAKSCLFMNQTLTAGLPLAKAKSFLKSLDSGVEVTFESYKQFNDIVLDVMEKISNLEYKLEFSQNTKGYNEYKILEVYDAE